ncbi:hypothetical protein SB359474_4802 [Shigella boydii 3594-74]|nr:hypothetical protein SB359474_4802 [Shigella boydii 3594-74]EJZ61083.1 hypothetical protein SF148580_4887 [Shigella flexneri 1485-80]
MESLPKIPVKYVQAPSYKEIFEVLSETKKGFQHIYSE